MCDKDETKKRDYNVQVLSKKTAKKLEKKFYDFFHKDQIMYGDELKITKKKCRFGIDGRVTSYWVFLVGLTCVNRFYVTKAKSWDIL